MSEELITIDRQQVLEIYSKPGGMSPIMEQMRGVVESFKHDVSTQAGRKETASLAHKVSKFKVYLDDIGKSRSRLWSRLWSN